MANSRQSDTALNLDLTIPDTARMMDYWLGGTHHFEVDRAMARSIEKMTPLAANWVRAQRQFLRRVVSYLYRELQHTCFLVAGAGLPTCSNVHEVVPEAKVLYTDINPVTVAYGRYILGDNPRVRYLNQDARLLHEVDPGEVQSLFGSSRRVAIIYIGFSYFFPDSVLRQTLSELYDRVAPGSHLAITSLGEDSTRYVAPSVEAYARMGHPLYLRSREQLLELLEPWKSTPHGVRAATHWGIDDATEPFPPVFVYSCLVHKPG